MAILAVWNYESSGSGLWEAERKTEAARWAMTLPCVRTHKSEELMLLSWKMSPGQEMSSEKGLPESQTQDFFHTTDCEEAVG